MAREAATAALRLKLPLPALYAESGSAVSSDRDDDGYYFPS